MNVEERTRRQQGIRLAEARKAAGYRSARAAALENGWPESTYRAHEAGSRTIGQDDAERYAKRFRSLGAQVEAKAILFGPDSDIAPQPGLAERPAQDLASNTDLSKAEDLPNFRGFGGPRDVPEYGAAVGGRRGDADFRFNGQTVDLAPRPPGILNKKDVYALRVTGDSMAPKYEEGERIYVDPHRTPSIMDYVVIELKPSEEGEPGDGFIKRLIRRTPTRIVVSQFNPPMELEFDRDEVKSVHRVIPTDELLGI